MNGISNQVRQVVRSERHLPKIEMISDSHTQIELLSNRQNRLRVVCTHFKSCDESLDKTSFDFSDIFRTMQSCAMNAKS